jgi:hypothetical protein
MSLPVNTILPIRVAKIKGYYVPKTEGYTNIIVKTLKDSGKWAPLSPYYLKDSLNRIMENIWQYSKIYQKVSAQKSLLHKNSNLVVWEYPEETHVTSDNNLKSGEIFKYEQITKEYWNWREKGMKNKYAVRYPNGFYGRDQCLTSIFIDEKGQVEFLDYITSRIKVYCRLYLYLIENNSETKPLLTELRIAYQKGEKLQICDVDGPTYDDYYPYNTVENSSIELSPEKVIKMLFNTRQPFGHGYVLAALIMNCGNMLIHADQPQLLKHVENKKDDSKQDDKKQE